MIDLPILDYIGWVSGAFSLAFYWLSGSGQMVIAYWCAIIAAALWVGIGVATEFGYATEFPSLIAIEGVTVILCFRGLHKLRRK